MTIRNLASVLSAPLLVAGATAADTFTDTFEASQNSAGWTINGNPNIDDPGGNPGGWLHNPLADTPFPVVRSDVNVPSRFVGNYRDLGVTTISFDARLLWRDWGDPVGFEMSIMLWDTHGTSDPSDDDYAYFVGPNVPLMGQGWVHYDFDIPSDDTSALPAGWSGGYFGDPENFRPGVDWNDVITSVDQVQISWLHPAFFAIFAQWDVGMDNISITTVDAPCVGDYDGDGEIGIEDFLFVLGSWGTPAADIDGDGDTGIAEFLNVLGNWGPC